MTPISDIITFSKNLTWKVFWVSTSLLIIAILCFLGFELYTSHFEHNSIERQANVLETLVELRTGNKLTKQEEEIRSGILSTLENKPMLWRFPDIKSFSLEWDKLLYGIIPWLLISIGVLVDKKTEDKGSAILGMIFIGSIFGGIATIFPFDGFFMKFIVVPYGLIFFTLILIVVIALIATKGKAKNEEEST